MKTTTKIQLGDDSSYLPWIPAPKPALGGDSSYLPWRNVPETQELTWRNSPNERPGYLLYLQACLAMA